MVFLYLCVAEIKTITRNTIELLCIRQCDTKMKTNTSTHTHTFASSEMEQKSTKLGRGKTQWMWSIFILCLLFYASTYTIYTVSEKVCTLLLPPSPWLSRFVCFGCVFAPTNICLRGVFIEFVYGLKARDRIGMFTNESAVGFKMITILEQQIYEHTSTRCLFFLVFGVVCRVGCFHWNMALFSQAARICTCTMIFLSIFTKKTASHTKQNNNNNNKNNLSKLRLIFETRLC